jgi:hypothetical protein
MQIKKYFIYPKIGGYVKLIIANVSQREKSPSLLKKDY